MPDRPIRLLLRVSPGAARDELVGRHGDGWKIRVAAAPEQGRANDAVLRLLARHLRLRRERLELVSGHGSRDKIVQLTGLDGDEVDRRLSTGEGRAT